MIRRLALIAPLALGLAACGAARDYPDLSRRPAERISGSSAVVAPSATPTPLPPPNLEFTGRLAQLVQQARSAHQRFTTRRPGAERLTSTASGAAAGSENWSIAAVALADLEAARSEVMVALAELDATYAAESLAAAETGNTGQLDAANAARDQVIAMVAEEDAAIARLGGRLRS